MNTIHSFLIYGGLVTIDMASYIWAPPQYRDGLFSYGIPIKKVRRSTDHLIFIMRISILIRHHLYIETSPGWTLVQVIASRLRGHAFIIDADLFSDLGTSGTPFTNMDQLCIILAKISNVMKCEMKLLIHSQTSTVSLLKYTHAFCTLKHK